MTAVNQEQLDALYAAGLDMAEALLARNGEFFPFAHYISPQGEITALAVHDGDEHPESAAVIASLQEKLKGMAGRGEAIASAISANVAVRKPDDGGRTDAVLVQLRAEGYARDAVMPFALSGGGLFRKAQTVEMGQPFAQEAENEIF
ncbi:hypothetical protein [Parasphingopyxis marina]|uniref:Uncharacterized protein n=1 Tax=Parasphingopyxis marina TaxID=2761622 RepID=A0A842HU93_9SPHN|nr:hypothetical protein [Parasphingopyxis marina]MBC2776592.1 hypothetical protein [Parasphingopyxis marina]